MSKGFKKRKLAIALSACMALSSGVVHALGMGEIEVNTALNEPLDAKIKLFSATPDELNSLEVKLASQDVFSRMGIDQVPVLRNLQFQLVSEGQGAPYIKVSSARPVKEPFLDFILAVQWASGQMMREYTLLLDPPVFERDQQVGRVSAATTQPSQVVREQAPAAAPQSRITPPGSYGPTARTDTLWAIAQDMRPNNSISVPQMMIALLKENPEAFEDNNINNLKAGYVLRQPEMDVITALSKRAAAAESNRQYQQWQAARGQAPAPTGRQQRVAESTAAPAAEAAAPAAVAAPQAEPQGRLQLLSPDEEARIRAGVGSGTAGEASESLRQQLAIAQETAEATRQENAELRGRLDELEQQLQSVQKLLTLQDDTLGALQAEARQDEQQPQAAAEQPGEAPAAQQPAAPAAQPTPVETSLLDEVLANPTYMYAGGGLLILLLLVALMMRRRRQDDDHDFTVMTPVAAPEAKTTDKASADVAAASAAGVAPVAAAASAAADAEEEVAIGDIGGGLGTIQAEESEIDPIAEADVYLAYRRYEQAEALLKEAISADSERHELKLKLLEIYHATKDVDSFEAQAESLYAALGGQNAELWAQAVEMGRELLPAHPLFAEGGANEADGDVELGIEPADGGEQFNFDDEQQALSQDSDALSDEDLAGSLGLGGLGGPDEDMTQATEAADRAKPKDAAAESLDDLGDLDLDLDLESGDLDLDADTRSDKLAGAEPETDELALGGEALDDLGAAHDSLDGLPGVAADESATADDSFNLAAELTGESEADIPVLDTEPDDFSVDKAEEDAAGRAETLDDSDAAKLDADESELPAQAGLSLAADDGHLDDSEDPYANVDVNSFASEESKDWQVEAAQSVFHTHEVTSETDGLLDSARKKAEPDNGIAMDSLAEPQTEETSAEADDTEITEARQEDAEDEFIDPLADLSEMDFGNLADEDNDDIFDNSDDMIGTKLDLAKAYIDMGDQDGARSILDEVVEEGDDDQRQEAEQLKQQIS